MGWNKSRSRQQCWVIAVSTLVNTARHVAATLVRVLMLTWQRVARHRYPKQWDGARRLCSMYKRRLSLREPSCSASATYHADYTLSGIRSTALVSPFGQSLIDPLHFT